MVFAKPRFHYNIDLVVKTAGLVAILCRPQKHCTKVQRTGFYAFWPFLLFAVTFWLKLKSLPVIKHAKARLSRAFVVMQVRWQSSLTTATLTTHGRLVGQKEPRRGSVRAEGACFYKKRVASGEAQMLPRTIRVFRFCGKFATLISAPSIPLPSETSPEPTVGQGTHSE